MALGVFLQAVEITQELLRVRLSISLRNRRFFRPTATALESLGRGRHSKDDVGQLL
jgi:hypothetical protein